MSKNSHRTPKSSKVPTKQPVQFEQVYDIFTMRKKPMSMETIEQLAMQSVESALNKKNDLTALGFFSRLGYGTMVQKWREKSAKFDYLYQERKRIISDKRETGGLLKDPDKEYLRLDSNMARFSMPLYDSEWRDLEVQRAKDKIEDGSVEQKVIVIERFPEAK
jgi:hypothetical protein